MQVEYKENLEKFHCNFKNLFSSQPLVDCTGRVELFEFFQHMSFSSTLLVFRKWLQMISQALKYLSTSLKSSAVGLHIFLHQAYYFQSVNLLKIPTHLLHIIAHM